MFLDYLALTLLIVGAILVFYTFVYIHDLPHKIAERRSHPHVEAIGIACWLSLLTLHAIWPIVFIWAMTKRGEPLVGGQSADEVGSQLDARLKKLEERIAEIEINQSASEDTAT